MPTRETRKRTTQQAHESATDTIPSDNPISTDLPTMAHATALLPHDPPFTPTAHTQPPSTTSSLIGVSFPSPLRSLETAIVPPIARAARAESPAHIAAGHGAAIRRRRPRSRSRNDKEKTHEYPKRDLSTGAKVGIIIGGSIGMVLIILLCRAFWPEGV